MSEELSILNKLEKRIMENPLSSDNPTSGSFHAIPNADKLSKPTPEPPPVPPEQQENQQIITKPKENAN